MSTRTRYVQVGVGGRHAMFRKAVVDKFHDSCELVGLCDNNPGRLEFARQEVGMPSLPLYDAEDFDRMIKETSPDWVIVTTPDCYHDEYICRAMEAGCDTITEKPMTINAGKCRRILETEKKTGRECRVTFNYRYSPPRTQVKDLLMSGVIGDILSVDFHWLLDTHHGADYFRRWHRNKENSGGLLVHKATHHFDLVNWWLSAIPEEVFASGHRKFYTPSNAANFDLNNRGERCHTCPVAEKCPFRLDLASKERLKNLYLNCEQYDGYYRDKCVFSDAIDIEDSMNLVVNYQNGVKLTYSLNAFCSWEGYHICFNGTKGRLEHKCQESVYINADGSVPGALDREGTWTHVFPLREPAYGVDVWEAKGGHGGGDEPLLRDLFDSSAPEDKYKRAADQRAGSWSILTGVAGNVSIAEKRPVSLEELVPASVIGEPDYPVPASAQESTVKS